MKRAGFLFSSILLFFLAVAPSCPASQYDIKKMTPEISQALKARQSRYIRLQSLKQEGVVGENNRGYLTNLKDGMSAGGLAAAENEDRKTIYRALVDQNGLGQDGMKEVERAFAEVQREKAVSGEMIQTPSGDWVRK